MAVAGLSLSSLFLSPSLSSSAVLRPPLPPQLHFHHHLGLYPSLNASRRTFNSFQESDELLDKRRSGLIKFVDECEEEEDDCDEEEDRSLDLLVRFVENVFRKVSRRARKAVRSVLPFAISTKLVRFAVNGALILAFMWVLKAFLQVLCTFGSVVFVSILLIRGVSSGITYFQHSRNFHLNQIDNHGHGQAWTKAQPAS